MAKENTHYKLEKESHDPSNETSICVYDTINAFTESMWLISSLPDQPTNIFPQDNNCSVSCTCSKFICLVSRLLFLYYQAVHLPYSKSQWCTDIYWLCFTRVINTRDRRGLL